MSTRIARRNFIRLLGSGGVVTMVPSVLGGCDDADGLEPTCLPAQPPSEDPFDVWVGPQRAADIRLTVLSYALLAPNPHNLQPWLVELRGDREFDVYVDPDRLLPETDPHYRQIHIGVGTFLELAAIAAGQHAHRASIEYFPEGEYSNDVLEPKPVARVRLIPDPDAPADPLFDAIATRSSNKTVYDGRPISAATLDQLRALAPGAGADADADGGPVLRVDDAPEFLDEMAEFVIDAMAVEVGHAARDRETLDTWRFSDAELLEHRDGTDARWFVDLGYDRETLLKPGSPWVDSTVRVHEGMARSAAAFGWIQTSSNTRSDQLEVGRLYARLNLLATSVGVAMSPFSQVLQEYSDMHELKTALEQTLGVPQTHTVQMLFRLGHAAPAAPTPRRRATDFTPC